MKHHFEVWVLRGYVWDLVHQYAAGTAIGAWANMHMYKNRGVVRILMDGRLYYRTNGRLS